jgi:hypothetical protein
MLNKLECMSLATFHSYIIGKRCSLLEWGTLLYELRAGLLHYNTCWKNLALTNDIAYFDLSSVMKKKVL